MERKTLVTTGPGEPHSFARIKGETTRYAEVSFDFVDAQGAPLELPFAEMLSVWAGHPSPVRTVQSLSEPATAALEEKVERLIRVGLSSASELIFLRLATELIGILEHCLVSTLNPVAPGTPWEKAYRILLEDFARDLPMTELAARLGVHPDYLARRFRKAYGMAPVAFQTWLRIEAAKTWLVSTEYTLKEIAERVGFNDPGYFARAFRLKTGMAPGRFRQAARAGNGNPG